MKSPPALPPVGEEPLAQLEHAPGPGPNSEAPSALEMTLSRKHATPIRVQVMIPSRLIRCEHFDLHGLDHRAEKKEG